MAAAKHNNGIHPTSQTKSISEARFRSVNNADDAVKARHRFAREQRRRARDRRRARRTVRGLSPRRAAPRRRWLRHRRRGARSDLRPFVGHALGRRASAAVQLEGERGDEVRRRPFERDVVRVDGPKDGRKMDQSHGWLLSLTLSFYSHDDTRSLYGRDFLRRAHSLLKVDDDDDVDVQFQEHGYLFLAASEQGKEQLTQNNEVQQSAGCKDIHLMDPTQLEQKFPWLNTSDIALGSFGEAGEGWFDPWALIRGLKRKCQSMGVTIVQGSPVGAARDESSGRVLSVEVMEEERHLVRYNAGHVVNAAGAHCSKVMETLAGAENGSDLMHPVPVEPRKRSIFFIHCNTQQSSDVIVPHVAPLTVCPVTGVYFRSEGLIGEVGAPTGNFLCGVSPPQEMDRAVEDVSELDHADYELWDEVIWPALYHRVPAFGEVKVRRNHHYFEREKSLSSRVPSSPSFLFNVYREGEKQLGWLV